MELILTLLLLVFGLPAIIAMAISGVVTIGYLAIVVFGLAMRFWYITLAAIVLALAPLFYLSDWFIYALCAVLFYAAATILLYIVNWLNKHLDRLNQKLS
ncbi:MULTISPECIES: hypothetical protein [Rodentibacter]|uniref:Uncharacterized protein n=1 Tax=Rodentibacter caecimuris TaxID=1796644 RepID=A0AAJ3N067_9PAST|nr:MULTISPECIES: hypothetical protein [Rodentibacter]OOF60856.1 hypothetical protein BH925_04280 [Rodentibacter pneumotropicus]OOF64761.1 hypothetical protein BKL50_00705 [Rodentibacter pneumotropicus]OOF70657.1 hypothetical protein BKG90_09635 [Rodentibacter heylii]OOF76551.1 hypothetical protein BKG91_00050 [Rodentibacter heylii]OOF78328.1 hypothetical protein BKG99_00800 [Rodentibacter heylii]